MVALLPDNGADLDTSSFCGDTPFHLLLRRVDGWTLSGCFPCHGANLEAEDAVGLTPRNLAMNSRQQDVVRPLLERGADL